VEARYPNAPEKLKFNEALKLVLNRFVTGLIEGTKANLQQVKVQSVIQSVVQSVVQSVEDVRRHPERLVGFPKGIDVDRLACKEFLHKNLYFSKALEAEKEEAERVVRELFDHWMRRPSDLPSAYREKARSEELPRVICDYIAGMTDHFILEQYRKFRG